MSTLSLVLSQCRGAAAVQRRQEALIYQVCICVVGIFHLTSESVAGVVLLLWQTALYLVTGLGGV